MEGLTTEFMDEFTLDENILENIKNIKITEKDKQSILENLDNECLLSGSSSSITPIPILAPTSALTLLNKYNSNSNINNYNNTNVDVNSFGKELQNEQENPSRQVTPLNKKNKPFVIPLDDGKFIESPSQVDEISSDKKREVARKIEIIQEYLDNFSSALEKRNNRNNK
ncbi:16676_t:CDS:2 [Entrophospora sp. SA101]|nr:16676_t:CDS:2 [Entrophospora sp. SA101]CAJ0840905.1 3989_t:CDS:2 [Entrophospora sp. SA101]CAJ0909020.1 759_t:CDS:2 [Entrophospora sp. SA101]